MCNSQWNSMFNRIVNIVAFNTIITYIIANNSITIYYIVYTHIDSNEFQIWNCGGYLLNNR